MKKQKYITQDGRDDFLAIMNHPRLQSLDISPDFKSTFTEKFNTFFANNTENQ